MNEEKLYSVLNRIATALETLASARTTAQAMQTQSPNFKRSIDDYPNFDWSSIKARVIAHDRNGATIVEWHEREFKRRNHAKFGKGLWFSTYREKVDDKNLYDRLISFVEDQPVEQLPSSIASSLPTPPPSPAPAPSPTPARPTTPLSIDAKAALDAMFPR